MEFLHEELRRAREKAGLSQQALADKAGIPRNQVVRAEKGANITVDTLRKIAAYLPVTELTLLDTKGLRVDMIPQPEKLFIGAVENVMRLTDALMGGIQLAMDARNALEEAHRANPSAPIGLKADDLDSIFPLRGLQQIVAEIEALGRMAKIAS